MDKFIVSLLSCCNDKYELQVDRNQSGFKYRQVVTMQISWQNALLLVQNLQIHEEKFV